LERHSFKIFDVREANWALISCPNFGFVLRAPLARTVEYSLVFPYGHSKPRVDRQY